MTMSVYRVNSAYLRTSSVNNKKTAKSNLAQNVSFQKSTPKKLVNAIDKFVSLIRGHVNDNSPRVSENYILGRHPFAVQKALNYKELAKSFTSN